MDARKRQRQGVTQVALAKRLRSSQSRVAKMEAGDPRADAGERLVVTEDAAGIGVGEALNGLPDVDLGGEVVPSGGVGEAPDEPPGLGLDVRGVTHSWKLELRTACSLGRDNPNGLVG